MVVIGLFIGAVIIGCIIDTYKNKIEQDRTDLDAKILLKRNKIINSLED